MSGRTVWMRAAVAAAATLLVTSGCGGGGQLAPVDQQPRLAQFLTDVDDEIGAGRYVQARQTLNELVRAALSARATGALDTTSADRVLASASQLMSQLTASIEGRRAAVTPAEPTITGDEGDQGDQGDGEAGGDGHGHQGHGHGKPPKPEKP